MMKSLCFGQAASGWRAVRVFLWVAIMAGFLASIPNRAYAADDRAPYAIGLWGDLPYSTLQATVGVPNLIADMNSQNLAFTAHDGDLKSGSSECTDAIYTPALGYFNSLQAPAVFTPGDNDWVDCDRTAGYSSLAQLDKERQLFFSTPLRSGSIGCISRCSPRLCVWG